MPFGWLDLPEFREKHTRARVMGFARAADALLEAFKLDPAQPQLREQLHRALSETGRHEEAQRL